MSSNGIYPALSGAVVESRNLETVANNLANVSTSSFRGQRLSFQSVLGRVSGAAGPGTRPTAAALRKSDSRFVQVSEALQDTTPGALRQTDQPTDLALSGPGFLAARTASGEAYFRGGSLQRAADGGLFCAPGAEVLGTDGQPIKLPAEGALTFGTGGEVMIDGKVIASLKLVEFPGPQVRRLRAIGGGLVLGPAGAPPPAAATATQVLQQHLEGSNISPVKAMTDIIVTSRHYEALHRVIEAFREIDGSAARDLAIVS